MLGTPGGRVPPGGGSSGSGRLGSTSASTATFQSFFPTPVWTTKDRGYIGRSFLAFSSATVLSVLGSYTSGTGWRTFVPEARASPTLVSWSVPERIRIRPSGRATVVGYQRWYFISDGSAGSVLVSSRG